MAISQKLITHYHELKQQARVGWLAKPTANDYRG